MGKVTPPILFLEQSQQGSRCRVTWHNVTAPRSCSFYSFRVFIFSWKFSAPIFLDTSNSHPIYRKHCGIAPKVISLSSFTFKIPNLYHDLLHEGRGPPLSLAAMARGWTLVEIFRVEEIMKLIKTTSNFQKKSSNTKLVKSKKIPQLMDSELQNGSLRKGCKCAETKNGSSEAFHGWSEWGNGAIGLFSHKSCCRILKEKTRAPSTNTFYHETWWP